MKLIYQTTLLMLMFSIQIYSKEIVLYPVYSLKYDKVNDSYMSKIKIEKQRLHTSKGIKPLNETFYLLNLNNLLLIQNEKDTDSQYYILGKIIINENNKLKYKYYKVAGLDKRFKPRNQKLILKKRLEIKKSIAYINNGNYTIEEIKKILDVDLINEHLGKKLYETKEVQISIKKATNNFINCRFCEQMIDIYSSEMGCYLYSLCHNEPYAIIFNNKYFDRGYIGSTKSIVKFYKDINKGNIYQQLDKKYISKTYEEWKSIVKKNSGDSVPIN